MRLRGTTEGQLQDLKGTRLLFVSISCNTQGTSQQTQTSDAFVVPEGDNEVYGIDGIYNPGNCEGHLHNS